MFYWIWSLASSRRAGRRWRPRAGTSASPSRSAGSPGCARKRSWFGIKWCRETSRQKFGLFKHFNLVLFWNKAPNQVSGLSIWRSMENNIVKTHIAQGRLFGWIDLDFGYSTVCLVLLGLIRNWQNWLSMWARWWNITDQSQPNLLSDQMGHPVHD